MLRPSRLETASLWLGLGGTALAFWPVGASTFHAPKTVLLIGAALLALIDWGLRKAPVEEPRAFGLALAWAASLALSATFGGATDLPALWLEVAAALWLLRWVAAPPATSRVLRGVSVIASIVAAVTLLQTTGFDPFSLLGLAPHRTSDRLAQYGTLGNPDFVAAWLGASVWLSVPALLSRRGGDGGSSAGALGRRVGLGLALGAVGVQAAAVVALQSWASSLSLLAGATFFLVRGRSLTGTQRWVAAASALLFALALVLAAGQRTRPLATSLKGRAYLLAVAAPHALDAPLTGVGPGGFERLWPQWEAEHVRAHGADERFVALQDHAHHDYLEWALGLGVLGLLVRVALLGSAWLRAARHAVTLEAVAIGSALSSLLARALVDFPFHRPAELCLLALLAGLSLRLRP